MSEQISCVLVHSYKYRETDLTFSQRYCWSMKFPDFRRSFVYYQLLFSFLVMKTWERGSRSKYGMKIGLDHHFPYSRWAFAPLTQHCWSLSRSSSLKAVRLGRPLSWRLLFEYSSDLVLYRTTLQLIIRSESSILNRWISQNKWWLRMRS